MLKKALILLSLCIGVGTLAAQETKTIWFKSPWGNKTLPRIVLGNDTFLMEVPTERGHCGWFYYTYTSSTSFLPVYFIKPESNVSFPTEGTLDLSSILTENNAVYIDGLNTSSPPSATMGTPGTCFDATYTIHFYWSETGTPYVSAGTAIPSTAMRSDARLANWYYHDLSSLTNNNLLISTAARNSGRNPVLTDYNPRNTLNLTQLFPPGIYDVWLIPTGNGNFSISYSPVSNKVIRFMNPWSNTSPTMVYNETSFPMSPVNNYCGWFQANLQASDDNVLVYFKQTLGTEVFSGDGLVIGLPFSLDSALALTDTVWILPTPIPSGPPVIHSRYPNVLGDCPVKNLAIMLIDWYDGSTRSGRNGYENRGGVQFGTGVNQNFGSSGCQNGTPGDDGITKGMVEKTLGPNGVPVRSAQFPETHCSNASHLNEWFIPVLVAEQNGVQYFNAVCKDLELSLDEKGMWFAQIDDNSSNGGFFLLDDFRYLDDANTIENPYYDSANGNRGYHNFGFVMKAVAEFEYVRGQYFEFNGDDDVWVFINNQLVVDIGGQHGKKFGSVDLDTLGLIEGKTYPFHIFYAERKVTQSNFMMRTSINLRTERSYFPIDVSKDPSVIQYQIWQITREQSLSCDFSGMSAKDTMPAPSNFTLFGGNLPIEGVSLNEGVNYGGVIIENGFTGFQVDTNSIHTNRSLPPGTYRLVFSMRGDATLTGEVWFTVSEYPRPSLSFADSNWAIISPDTSTIGEWANKMYPVYIRILEENCKNCDNILHLGSSNQNLIFMDAQGNTINSVLLVDGKAVFYVFATQEVKGAAIQVSNNAFANTPTWYDIDLIMPPVPQLEFAEMHDRNGDGIGDSLFLLYSKSLKGNDFPDSLFWSFGDSIKHKLEKKELQAIALDDRSFALVSNTGFTKSVFTGDIKNPYFGLATTWFTFTPEAAQEPILFDLDGQIKDRIGPIILSASLSQKSGGVVSLSLTFSEALQKGDEALFSSLFEYKFWREGQLNPSSMIPVSGAAKNLYRYDIVFIAKEGTEVPAVGDSIRFTPGVGTDLSENHPHLQNPWVRIVGDLNASIDATIFLPLDPKTAPTENSPIITTHLVDKDKKAKDLANEYGRHGHIIDFDMPGLLENLWAEGDTSATAETVKLVYEIHYFSSLGHFVNTTSGTIACSDEVFNGNCLTNPGNMFLAWNMRSHQGRLVGAGVYIARLQVKILSGKRVVSRKAKDYLWGVQRVKSSGIIK